MSVKLPGIRKHEEQVKGGVTMALFFQFISNPVPDLIKMASIQAATLVFLDESFWKRGGAIPSNFIRSDERDRAKPTMLSSTSVPEIRRLR